MPRTSRVLSSSGIYHVMARGIDKENIFNNTDDFLKFLSYIGKSKEKEEFKLYAYCLMPNHIHLLLQSHQDSLGKALQRIITPYAMYFNKVYKRRGHLFQNRYKSEPVQDDSYFLTALRYIHQNPVKAGLVKKVSYYPWSSYQEYEKKPYLIDPKLAIGMIGNKWMLLTHLKKIENDHCLDIETREHYTDKELLQFINSFVAPDKFQEGTYEERKQWIQKIRENSMASNRQIARVLHLGKSTINRLLKED